MTRKFVVAFQSEGDDLDMQVIEANNWREATLQHKSCPWTLLQEPEDEDGEDDAGKDIGDVMILPQDLDDAVSEAFDMGYVFGVLELGTLV